MITLSASKDDNAKPRRSIWYGIHHQILYHDKFRQQPIAAVDFHCRRRHNGAIFFLNADSTGLHMPSTPDTCAAG
jgi:hypothetical protein